MGDNEKRKTTTADLYLQWMQSGKVSAKLNEIQILAKAGSDAKAIAEWLRISIEEYEELKERYPEFKRAADPEECGELIRLVTDLQTQAKGYFQTTTRKNAYVTKSGENRLSKDETEHYCPGNPIIGIYLLEMFYGAKWNRDYNKVMARYDNKEEWGDGNQNDSDR